MMKTTPLLPLFLLFMPMLCSLTSCNEDEAVPEPCYTLEVASGDGQRGLPGETVPLTLNVRVLDDQGNIIQGAEVFWTVISGGGTLIEDTTQTSALGYTQVFLTLGPSETQTVTATLVRENEANCTGTTMVNFTAQVGSFELLSVSHTASEEADCQTSAGVNGYTQDFDLEYCTNLGLSLYKVELAKVFNADKPPIMPPTQKAATIKSSTHLGDQMCIIWGNWEWIELAYRVVLISKANNEVLLTSNEETIRIENLVEPPAEISTITLLSAESEVTEINSEFCKDINGSTVSAEINYEASAPLDGFFIEIIVYYKYSNDTEERSFESWAQTVNPMTLTDKNCFRWPTIPYVDLSYVVNLYKKGADGYKTGEVLASSNKVGPNRVTKPAGANRISSDYEEEGVGISN